MDFQREVIERSHALPVLVDFWAEWCGPCRMLTPVLEAVERDQEGRWALVKINTEEHQQLAAQYGIRSIPNVKMFHRGQVAAEFTGALTRPMLERWLDENLPDPEAGALERLLARASGWPDETMISDLEDFLQQNPSRADARIALARFLLITDPTGARKLVSDIPAGDKLHEAASDIITLVELMDFAGEDAPAAPLLGSARAALKAAETENALQHLIDAVSRDKNYLDGLPRRATVALFRLLGEQHPLTQTYRRKFSMALY